MAFIQRHLNIGSLGVSVDTAVAVADDLTADVFQGNDRVSSAGGGLCMDTVVVAIQVDLGVGDGHEGSRHSAFGLSGELRAGHSDGLGSANGSRVRNFKTTFHRKLTTAHDGQGAVHVDGVAACNLNTVLGVFGHNDGCAVRENNGDCNVCPAQG